jgi:hypothetical protein
MQRAQLLDEALELLLTCIAQKLQGNVPRFWRGPAEAVTIQTQSLRSSRKFVDHRGRQRNSNKKAHGMIIRRTGDFAQPRLSLKKAGAN